MGDSVDPEVMAKALGMEKKEVIRQLQAMQKNWEEQQRGIRLTEIDAPTRCVQRRKCTNI